MSLQQDDFGEYEKPFYRDGISLGRLRITSDGLWGGLSVIPVLFLYTLIALVPIVFAVWASLHSIPLMNPQWEFVGLQNYYEVFGLDAFWAALSTGVIYMVGSTIVQTVIGVWMALVVNKISLGQRLLSTLVFTAYLVPTIILSLIALFLIEPNYGGLRVLGESLGLWQGNLFGDTGLAMWALIGVGSWKFSVFITIFTLAQLRGIPQRFYEAAKICGATTWEMFRDITLPRIKGALLIAILLRSIFMFNKFDIIYQLTQGGPAGATTTLPILAYDETIIGGQYGFGNAISVVMFLFLFAGALAYLVAFNPSQEVET